MLLSKKITCLLHSFSNSSNNPLSWNILKFIISWNASKYKVSYGNLFKCSINLESLDLSLYIEHLKSVNDWPSICNVDNKGILFCNFNLDMSKPL